MRYSDIVIQIADQNEDEKKRKLGNDTQMIFDSLPDNIKNEIRKSTPSEIFTYYQAEENGKIFHIKNEFEIVYYNFKGDTIQHFLHRNSYKKPDDVSAQKNPISTIHIFVDENNYYANEIKENSLNIFFHYCPTKFQEGALSYITY
jgi:hypothetical protein